MKLLCYSSHVGGAPVQHYKDLSLYPSSMGMFLFRQLHGVSHQWIECRQKHLKCILLSKILRQKSSVFMKRACILGWGWHSFSVWAEYLRGCARRSRAPSFALPSGFDVLGRYFFVDAILSSTLASTYSTALIRTCQKRNSKRIGANKTRNIKESSSQATSSGSAWGTVRNSFRENIPLRWVLYKTLFVVKFRLLQWLYALVLSIYGAMLLNERLSLQLPRNFWWGRDETVTLSLLWLVFGISISLASLTGRIKPLPADTLRSWRSNATIGPTPRLSFYLNGRCAFLLKTSSSGQFLTKICCTYLMMLTVVKRSAERNKHVKERGVRWQIWSNDFGTSILYQLPLCFQVVKADMRYYPERVFRCKDEGARTLFLDCLTALFCEFARIFFFLF